MKSKNYLLVSAVIAAIFFSSCNPKTTPLNTSSGASIQDSVLPKTMFRLVDESGSYYFADYGLNHLVVDTATSPPTLTLTAQSAYYNATNTSSVTHNGTSTSQISSTVSVNTDTVTCACVGPFDMVNGYMYSTKGYLHYTNKATGDSTICPIAEIVYCNQNGSGQPMLIGYVTQNDLHAPKPSSQK